MYLWLCITASTAFMVLDAGTAHSALPMASMFFNTANTSASGSCFISSLFLLKASADTYQSLIAFLPHQLYFLKPSFSASSLKHWRQYTSPYFLITPPVLPHFLHLCTFFPDFLFFTLKPGFSSVTATSIPSIPTSGSYFIPGMFMYSCMPKEKFPFESNCEALSLFSSACRTFFRNPMASAPRSVVFAPMGLPFGTPNVLLFCVDVTTTLLPVTACIIFFDFSSFAVSAPAPMVPVTFACLTSFMGFILHSWPFSFLSLVLPY